MSYEGYVQCICLNGHRFDWWDIYSCQEPICDFCKAKAAFSNSVDQTNGEDVGYIHEESFIDNFLVTEEVIETCEHCGHKERKEPKVFRIPSKKEAEPYRTILVDVDDNYVTTRLTIAEFSKQQQAKELKERREEIEKRMSWAEYHYNLPHALSEEKAQAELIIQTCKKELMQLGDSNDKE